MSNAQLRQALRAGGDLVMTDSNRRRIEEWFTVVARQQGPDRACGQTSPDASGYDFRLRRLPRGDRRRPHGGRTGRRARRRDRRWRSRAARGPAGARLRRRSPHFLAGRRSQPDEGEVGAPRPIGPCAPTGSLWCSRRTVHVTAAADSASPVRPRPASPSILRPDSLAAREVRWLTFPAAVPCARSVTFTGATSKPPVDPKLANAVGFAEVRLGGLRVHRDRPSAGRASPGRGGPPARRGAEAPPLRADRARLAKTSSSVWYAASCFPRRPLFQPCRARCGSIPTRMTTCWTPCSARPPRASRTSRRATSQATPTPAREARSTGIRRRRGPPHSGTRSASRSR